MYDHFFSQANQFLNEGLPFATAIVVRAEKPTSAKPGDKAIITPTGVMHGWIGGSCAQPTVIEQAMKALAEGEPRLIRLSTTNESQSRQGLIELPMTCFSGGTLEIYIEPHLPAPRLMIVGHLPIAQALAQLGKTMGYYVIAFDPDKYQQAMAHADDFFSDLGQMAEKITPLTYIVVASHGQYDELALDVALRSKAAYVALVASKRRATTLLDYLKTQGLMPEQLARLKYPAGLDIQAIRGDEIALSIMAEIVQQRRNTPPLNVLELLEEELPAQKEAIDPICGMTVQIKGAMHTLEHQAQTFYFCCGGCQNSFAKQLMTGD